MMKALSIRNLMFALGAFCVFSGRVMAQATGPFFNNPQGGENIPAAVTRDNLGQSITTLINYALGILGLIAVAFLIYAGVLMVTAGGNDDQVGKGKTIITYAVIGIIIILLSWTIVSFVTQSLSA